MDNACFMRQMICYNIVQCSINLIPTLISQYYNSMDVGVAVAVWCGFGCGCVVCVWMWVWMCGFELARWTEKLAGELQAGTSDSPH